MGETNMELVIAVATTVSSEVYSNFLTKGTYMLISYWPTLVLSLPEQTHFWGRVLHSGCSMGMTNNKQKSEKSGVAYF